MTLITLKKRRDFLRLRGGRRCQKPAFILETKPSPVRATPALASDAATVTTTDAAYSVPAGPRFGFTITKKIGNAVVRNKIRRRLKHAVRDLAPTKAQHGFDYVLVARRAAATQSFEQLKNDLERCFERVHDPDARGKPGTTSHRA